MTGQRTELTPLEDLLQEWYRASRTVIYEWSGDIQRSKILLNKEWRKRRRNLGLPTRPAPLGPYWLDPPTDCEAS